MSDDLLDLLEIEAERRLELHVNSPGRRPLSEDYELVGLVGEAEFATTYDLPLNLRRLPGGDRGVDFVVPLAFSVDVKCFRKAINLIQEQDKVVADIYVLSEYSDIDRHARLLGWEYGSILARAPVKDFGYGIITHYIHRDYLRPMDDLGSRMMRLVIR
jgi:hypothetical protein